MRVLFVTPSYFPIVGGSEVLTRVLAQKVNEAGVHADIMTLNMSAKWFPRWRNEFSSDGSVRVFRQGALNPLPRLPNPLSILLKNNVIPRLGFVKKFRDYDILHFVGEDDLSLSLFSCFVNRPKLMQCVAIHRNGGFYRYFIRDRPYFGKLFTKVFPSIADKFVVSTFEEGALLRDLSVEKEKISILKIGVDTETFQADPQKKTEDVILFVGRLYRIKGLHILLRALLHVETSVKLVVIGPAWDFEYMKEIGELTEAVTRRGFHSVAFLGELDSKALVPWYQRAAMVVCPFLYEPCSNVVREALACGAPVISTGTHIVESCSDGIFTVERNPQSIADAINSLLKDSSVRRRLEEEGRSTIEQSFSWKSIIEELLKLYQDVSISFLNP